jgi:hypothetical protein
MWSIRFFGTFVYTYTRDAQTSYPIIPAHIRQSLEDDESHPMCYLECSGLGCLWYVHKRCADLLSCLTLSSFISLHLHS